VVIDSGLPKRPRSKAAQHNDDQDQACEQEHAELPVHVSSSQSGNSTG